MFSIFDTYFRGKTIKTLFEERSVPVRYKEVLSRSLFDTDEPALRHKSTQTKIASDKG